MRTSLAPVRRMSITGRGNETGAFEEQQGSQHGRAQPREEVVEVRTERQTGVRRWLQEAPRMFPVKMTVGTIEHFWSEPIATVARMATL